MKDTGLQRFLDAQEGSYERALTEMRLGQKRSHWIWYIFPQIAGLGMSGISAHYSIGDLQEARDYLAQPVLRKRLLEISEALLNLESSDPGEVMGYPDDLKLRSSMTLFIAAEPENEVFQKVLDKFFGGIADKRTEEILRKQGRDER